MKAASKLWIQFQSRCYGDQERIAVWLLESAKGIEYVQTGGIVQQNASITLALK